MAENPLAPRGRPLQIKTLRGVFGLADHYQLEDIKAAIYRILDDDDPRRMCALREHARIHTPTTMVEHELTNFILTIRLDPPPYFMLADFERAANLANRIVRWLKSPHGRSWTRSGMD